jgi:3-oxoacyl-[acyl-carrier protein] reductase
VARDVQKDHKLSSGYNGRWLFVTASKPNRQRFKFQLNRVISLPMATTSLSGKVALVTGSSRSIGAAIAKRLADDGANVVINYVSNPNAADEVVSSINAHRPGAAVAVKADVSTIAGGQELLDATVRSFGKIDIIVLNAGIMGSKTLEDIDEQFYDDHMNVNVKGPFFLVKAAAPLLTAG